MDVNEIDSRVGKRVVLVREDIFGNETRTAGAIEGPCSPRGFYRNGEWSLYGGDGWSPEFIFAFLPKGKRKARVAYLSHVLRIEEVA